MEDSLLGVLGTSEKRIKERPDQVKKMVRAIVKSLVFIRQQPEQVTAFAQRFGNWIASRPRRATT